MIFFVWGWLSKTPLFLLGSRRGTRRLVCNVYTLEDKHGTYKSPLLKGTWSSKPPWLCSMLIFRGLYMMNLISFGFMLFFWVGHDSSIRPSVRYRSTTQILPSQRVSFTWVSWRKKMMAVLLFARLLEMKVKGSKVVSTHLWNTPLNLYQ